MANREEELKIGKSKGGHSEKKCAPLRINPPGVRRSGRGNGPIVSEDSRCFRMHELRQDVPGQLPGNLFSSVHDMPDVFKRRLKSRLI